MGTYKFHCSICKKNCSAESKRYFPIKAKYGVKKRKELDNVYICPKCRNAQKPKRTTPKRIYRFKLSQFPDYVKPFLKVGRRKYFNFLRSPKMRTIREKIWKMVLRVEESGFKPTEVETFNANLKYLLDMNNVRGYNVVVYKNQFVGILYHWIDGKTNVTQKISHKQIVP